MESLPPRKLPKSLLLEIFRFLTPKELFFNRLYSLSRALYTDDTFMKNLLSQGIMQKLGIINDYGFEIEYFIETLGRDKMMPILANPEANLKMNYKGLETREEYHKMFLLYPRKRAQHQYLFGH